MSRVGLSILYAESLSCVEPCVKSQTLCGRGSIALILSSPVVYISEEESDSVILAESQ